MSKPQEVVVRVVIENNGGKDKAEEFREVGKRTPSQKLRLALMARYKKFFTDPAQFETWYEKQMELIIDSINKM